MEDVGTWQYWVIEFFVIALAVGAIDEIREWVSRYRNQDRDDIVCELCQNVRVLHQTFDKKFWGCARCCKIYRLENKK